MSTRKLIRNGVLVTASDTFEADILIEKGKITQIGIGLMPDERTEVVDAAGCYVIPGGIDPHTHLDMPFGGTVTADDFATGTTAAAFGGTTTIIDFCLTQKGRPLIESLQEWHAKAEGKAAIDYGFHLMIGEMNDQVLEELPQIIEEEGHLSRCSWHIKTSFRPMTGFSSRRCKRQKSTAHSSWFMPRTGMSLTCWFDRRSPKGAQNQFIMR